MTTLTSSTDLKSAHAALMAGYREALRRGDQIDMLNRAFIHHVVVKSSEAVYNRLVTRIDNAQTLAAETKEFADEVAKKDRLGSVLSFAQAQAKEQSMNWLKLVGLGGVAAGVLAFFAKFMASFAGIGEAGLKASEGISTSAGIQLMRLLFVGGGIFTIYKWFWNTVTETFHLKLPAHDILFGTLDQPETKFFALMGSSPPSRPTINLIGPSLAIVLILIGFGVAFFFFAFMIGIFS